MNGTEITSITAFVDDLLPEHVQVNYPELVGFAKAYAEYLQTENRAGYYTNRVDEQRDIDMVDEEFLTLLQREIGVAVPRQFAAEPRLFYKQLTSFYRARGTSNSIESFFKLLFDDEVEIDFPKDEMLIPSDGKWANQASAVEASPDSFTPLFTFTVGSTTNIIEGQDDNGLYLEYDNPIVFKNNTYMHPSEYTSSTYIRTYDSGEDINTDDAFTEVLSYRLTFEEDLVNGDTIEIYRSGAFTTIDGFVSDKRFIQDSFFYQKFSYVLRTGSNIDLWKNAFNRLVHPAGFIFFGEILLQILALEDGLGTFSGNEQPGFVRGGLPIPITIPAIEVGSSFVKRQNQLLASFIVKEFVFQAQANKFGPAEHFDLLKFKFTSPISEFSDFTLNEAINKTIKVNIDSFIEIEQIP